MKRTAFSIRAVLTLAASAFLVGGTALAASSGSSEIAKKKNPPLCSNDLKHRTAEEAIQEHLALLQAGMIEQAMCDYADDAELVLPGQVITGVANIRAGLEQVLGLIGVSPTILTFTPTDSLVMITFTALGSPCQVPDGSDTYVVRKGKIVSQTVHDTFKSAPGQTCPLAAPGS
ncbi:MAG: hypothetical protein ABW133_20975 [Polyangiaceae bacterium]